ncbi:hypothetical protein HK405_011588 [Cladochytrium tenue]|nr:hypothetical protein HK405_011588 [Cladochytrium tenue]
MATMTTSAAASDASSGPPLPPAAAIAADALDTAVDAVAAGTPLAAAAAAKAPASVPARGHTAPATEATILERLKAIRELLLTARSATPLPASPAAAAAVRALASLSLNAVPSISSAGDLAAASAKDPSVNDDQAGDSSSNPKRHDQARQSNHHHHHHHHSNRRRHNHHPNLARLWKEVVGSIKRLAALRSGLHAAETRENLDPAIAAETNDVLEDLIPMFIQFWCSPAISSSPSPAPSPLPSTTASPSPKPPPVTSPVEQLYPIYVSLARSKHALDQLEETGLVTLSTLRDTETSLLHIKDALETYASTTNSPANVSAAAVAVSGTGRASSLNVSETGLSFAKRAYLARPDAVSEYFDFVDPDSLNIVTVLARLRETISTIAPALRPVYERLVKMKSELSSLLARGSPHAFSLAEVQVIQDELREIDSVRIDGKFLAREDASVLPGQAAVIDLLESCYDDAHELLALREAIDGENPLRPVYERLVAIKARLEHAQKIAKWGIRPEDLVPVQIELGEIDNLRVDGKFLGAEPESVELEDPAGAAVPEGQAVLHFLLHKCYRIVYKLQVASEPVADALLPMYTQLETIHRCLLELKKWRVRMSPRDLSMYQMRLAAIDNQRVDGRFLDEDGAVPEGQGILHEKLHDCYEMLQALQHASSSAPDEDSLDSLGGDSIGNESFGDDDDDIDYDEGDDDPHGDPGY